MIVFYTLDSCGNFRHDFIQVFAELIVDTDVSWWAVPGTLVDEAE